MPSTLLLLLTECSSVTRTMIGWSVVHYNNWTATQYPLPFLARYHMLETLQSCVNKMKTDNKIVDIGGN